MNDQREIISWVDEQTWLTARAMDVTSTESPSLYGFGRETAFELACRKDGKTESRFKPNERTEIGKEIEHAIAVRAARMFGVKIKHKNEYMRIHSARMGSSFDYEVVGISDDVIDDNRLRQAFGSMGPGLLEVKNVDRFVFKDDWQVGEDPEAPAHIEIQLQHQMEVSEYAWGVIVAFVGGNHIEIVLRLRDQAVGAAIRHKIGQFWHGLSRGEYPPLLLPEDLGILKQLHKYAEPGAIFDAREDDAVNDWIQVYMDASADEKAAKDRKDTAQANLLQLIGEAERVVGASAVITCGMVGPCEVAYTRKGFRNWRVTPKKGIKE
jgi:predicted phage-related endonuclease